MFFQHLEVHLDYIDMEEDAIEDRFASAFFSDSAITLNSEPEENLQDENKNEKTRKDFPETWIFHDYDGYIFPHKLYIGRVRNAIFLFF
jgi:hypothetical protein